MKRIIKSGRFVDGQFNFELPKSKASKGHYFEVLLSIHRQLQVMLSYHCKVLVVRFDLHLHDFTGCNSPVSKFFRKLHKRLGVSFKQLRFGFVWCREHSEAAAQHYHCAIMLNGNKTQHPHSVLQLIELVWVGWGHPKPFTPKSCFYRVGRGDEEVYRRAFKRLSYLAKVDTKGKRPATTADYGSSRLKPKLAA